MNFFCIMLWWLVKNFCGAGPVTPAISHTLGAFSGNSSMDAAREDIQDPSEAKYLITKPQHCLKMGRQATLSSSICNMFLCRCLSEIHRRMLVDFIKQEFYAASYASKFLSWQYIGSIFIITSLLNMLLTFVHWNKCICRPVNEQIILVTAWQNGFH